MDDVVRILEGRKRGAHVGDVNTESGSRRSEPVKRVKRVGQAICLERAARLIEPQHIGTR